MATGLVATAAFLALAQGMATLGSCPPQSDLQFVQNSPSWTMQQLGKLCGAYCQNDLPTDPPSNNQMIFFRLK